MNNNKVQQPDILYPNMPEPQQYKRPCTIHDQINDVFVCKYLQIHHNGKVTNGYFHKVSVVSIRLDSIDYNMEYVTDLTLVDSTNFNFKYKGQPVEVHTTENKEYVKMFEDIEKLNGKVSNIKLNNETYSGTYSGFRYSMYDNIGFIEFEINNSVVLDYINVEVRDMTNLDIKDNCIKFNVQKDKYEIELIEDVQLLNGKSIIEWKKLMAIDAKEYLNTIKDEEWEVDSIVDDIDFSLAFDNSMDWQKGASDDMGNRELYYYWTILDEIVQLRAARKIDKKFEENEKEIKRQQNMTEEEIQKEIQEAKIKEEQYRNSKKGMIDYILLMDF
jgi:hypothetical protein